MHELNVVTTLWYTRYKCQNICRSSHLELFRCIIVIAIQQDMPDEHYLNLMLLLIPMYVSKLNYAFVHVHERVEYYTMCIEQMMCLIYVACMYPSCLAIPCSMYLYFVVLVCTYAYMCIHTSSVCLGNIWTWNAESLQVNSASFMWYDPETRVWCFTHHGKVMNMSSL